MSEQHTPGPWRVENDEIVSSSQRMGASVAFVTARVGSRTFNADSRLIAAAPDLLEIAKMIAESGEPCFICSTAPHRSDCGLITTIAKADGR